MNRTTIEISGLLVCTGVVLFIAAAALGINTPTRFVAIAKQLAISGAVIGGAGILGIGAVNFHEKWHAKWLQDREDRLINNTTTLFKSMNDQKL